VYKDEKDLLFFKFIPEYYSLETTGPERENENSIF